MRHKEKENVNVEVMKMHENLEALMMMLMELLTMRFVHWSMGQSRFVQLTCVREIGVTIMKVVEVMMMIACVIGV